MRPGENLRAPTAPSCSSGSAELLVVDDARSASLQAAVKTARSQQSRQAGIYFRRGVQRGAEALKLFSAQCEVHLVKDDVLCLFAGSLENKILHRQTGKVSASGDEVNLVSCWMQDDCEGHCLVGTQVPDHYARWQGTCQ